MRNIALLLKYKRLSSLYLILIVIYLLQTLIYPSDKSVLLKYHITNIQAKLLGLTVALPYIIIWIIALIGYLGLYQYAVTIQKDRDGASFKEISAGVFWISLWLPLSAILSSLSANVELSHPSTVANLTRLNNYFSLIILVTGFYVIYNGTQKLLPLINKRGLTNHRLIVGYIIFSALYVYLTLKDPARTHPTKSVHISSYYESDWLILITLVIPRLIYWYFGIQAAYSLFIYRLKVKGKLYQQALQNLSTGLIFIIVMTISLRCLQSLSTAIEKFNLELLLALVYGLLILMAAGFIYIAKGAKRLQEIESV